MIGTTLNQRFSLDQELGRGGMGTVYRATDLVLQRTVAIKVLKDASGEEFGRRLRVEAQILARLLHENVVRLYDFGVDGGTYFFVMEEVEGSSYQKRWKKLELADRVAVMGQVAEALQYAHQQGVIHRDVKPANVLLTLSDQAKLSDFGLSLLADAHQEHGVVRGTPHYMSPEQARGKRLDFRTDLYALGVMLYESATGSTPFQGPVMTIMGHHVNTAPEPPRSRNPEISESFEQLILRLLSKDPDGRPSSGREVASLLRTLREEGRLLATSEAAGPTTSAAVVAAQDSSDQVQGQGLAGTASREAIERVSGRHEPGQPATAAVPGVESPRDRRGRLSSKAARDMLDVVEAEPITLTPNERYLGGHYLAYLLGGSRRRGIFQRRPLDPLNADRARVLLAMGYLMVGGADKASIARAARLLDTRPDVRAALSPVHLMKYLASRDTPAKRKHFRQVRRRLAEASPYAARNLLDAHGVLNPGLIPQSIEDLRRIAPERTEVDDDLVQRWNRVADVWRVDGEFRDSILRYATLQAHRDPASKDLWPEVVYPLIERARWQRRLRSRTEEMWDKVAENLHLPDPGLRMDRALVEAVPSQVVAGLDQAIEEFEDEPSLNEPAFPSDPGSRTPSMPTFRAESFEDVEPVQADEPNLIRIHPADPFRHTLGECRELWKESIAALRNRGGGTAARTLPIGPYRLAAVASIRGRAAGQLVLRGMPNKQIELMVPSFAGGGSGSRYLLAIWLYENQSLVITYMDNLGTQRYIAWDAAAGVQHNFQAPEDLNRDLYRLGYEVPHGLDRVLSRSYRPRNSV